VENRQVDGVVAVGCLSDYLKLAFSLQQGPQAAANQRMIVGNHYPNTRRHSGKLKNTILRDIREYCVDGILDVVLGRPARRTAKIL
jgi:hypothetical protein